MRVLLVTNDYPPKAGGIQMYLAGLVGALDAEVRILAPAARAAEAAGVHRGHRRFLWPTARSRRWVARHIEDFRPDFVLFGAPHPLAHLGPRLRRDSGIPYAVLCHGAEVTIPAAFPLLRSLVKYPLRRADALFAVSEFTAARVRRLSHRPVAVVGAGVDATFAPHDTAPRGPLIGCVSRFVPRKGQRLVLRAAAELRSGGSDVEVLLVGTGRDQKRLRRLARRLGVPTRFEVGVPYSRLPGLYREMTVFAMPSRSRWWGLEAEGLGIVYLEAAATGLPVIAGDSGGAPETVAPGETGFVVDGLDTLVEALRLLFDDPEGARRMGEAGRRRVEDRFAWAVVSERFLSGFSKALAEPSPEVDS